MTELDEVRTQIEDAAEAGDDATVMGLSERYRDLQVAQGQIPVVGRGFRAQSGREFQLATRALSMRRAGREDEATQLIRVISRERVARNITRDGRGRVEAALFGANRGLLNIGTLVQGAGEFVEDTVGGNQNSVTARQRMEDSSAVQDAVRARHPLSAGAGEVGGAALTLALPGGGASQAARGVSRVGRVASSASRGAGYGAAQGASDAFVRDRDVVEGAASGAQTGLLVGGGLSVLGQALAPAVRGLANRFLDTQGLRRLAEHVTPEQLNAVVNSVRRYRARHGGREPTLSEVAGAADETVASSAGRIIEGRAPASQVARERLQPIRESTSREFSEDIMPGVSTPRGAGGQAGNGAHPITSAETTRAMKAIAGSAIVARPNSPLHDFLVRPNVARLIRKLEPEDRALLDDAVDNGGPVTVRMLENIREKIGNLADKEGSSFSLVAVSDQIKRFADDATRGAYSRMLRAHGQNATREGIANAALRSPRAAQRAADDMSTSASSARDLAEKLGTGEAARIRGTAALTSNTMRSMDRFEPSYAVSAADEAADVAGEIVRTAAAPKAGGAASAALLIRSAARLGMTTEAATKFARDFTDPSKTQGAIDFLAQRIGGEPTMRFMQMLERAGVRPTVERTAAVGSRLAAHGPDTEIPASLEQQPAAEQVPAPEAEEFDPEQVELSSDTNAILAQADEFEESDPELAAQFRETGDRLAQLERLMVEAYANGDEEGAKSLAQQRRRILDNIN